MKNKKVVQIKCHVGIHFFKGDQTIEAKKHGAEMEILPMGVLVTKGESQVIVPYSNITHIQVADDEQKK